jgi:cyanate lyase
LKANVERICHALEPGNKRSEMMNKTEMTAAILDAKKRKKTTWSQIAKSAGLSEVYATSACLGENALSQEESTQIGDFLQLSSEVVEALTQYATKGEAAPTVPKEPLAYRFQEILYVYGSTIKELIEEKFGPGIMSAIDFTMDIERLPDPKGDRVKITMNGKFLGYKKW